MNVRRVAAGAALVLTAALAGGGGWTWVRYSLPELGKSPQPLVRLTAGGEEIAAFQGTTRRSQVWVPLNRIPRPVVDAVLVTEDRRFFLHGGIDWVAVARAAFTDFRHGALRQGGSTITQQLVRGQFLTPERTWGRKLRESAIALFLELRYPKERILEAYLNTVYLGHDGDVAVHGLGAAARHFLGKELAAVQPDEGALLAAAIAAPNKILGGAPDRARARRDAVLEAMRREGVLGEVEARAAVARPVGRRAGGARTLRAPYFVELARGEIARRVRLPVSGEVRIATTLDPTLQRAAESAVRRGIERIERRRGGPGAGRAQAALVAMTPDGGEIRALVGGRSYADSPFNRATRAARQPGSLFKPLVYLAAFEAAGAGGPNPLTAASLVRDEPMAVSSLGTWSPRNMDGRFRGSVTVRRALEESLNLPAVRVAQDVGPERVSAVARALGIRSPLAAVPSLALGTSEVTLLEITGAFAALANGGRLVEPTTLVEDSASARGAPPAPRRAVSAESAFLITHLLRGVMREGTGRSSARWGLSELTAGKTGTTDGLRDAWFVGYTRDLAVGVWVGTDDGAPLGLSGAQAALPIWAEVMQMAVRRSPPRDFTPPPGIVMASVDRDTGRTASFWCGGGPRIEEAFRAGSVPPSGCGDLNLAGPVEHIARWIRSVFR